jgi:PAS domain S-box-containing protein
MEGVKMDNTEKSKGIIERKRAVEALRESEERYRSVVDNIDLGIILMDFDHNILMANTHPGRMFGKTTSEIVGKKCFQEFEKRDTVCPHCPGIRAMATAQGAEFESEGVRDDGSRFNVRIHAFPTFGQDGTVTGFIEVVEDITERKRAEEAHKESEDRFRIILESIEDGYYEVDLAGNLTFFNDSQCKILGYPRDELTGMSYKHFAVEEDSRKTYQAINRVYATGIPAIMDHGIRRKDGIKRYVQTSMSLMKDAQGQPIGFRGILRDITERKKMEEERARLIEELQKTNKELLKSNQDLKESTLQLVQSDKMSALGELTAGVAHELNQPLNGIKIVSQSLLRDIEKDRLEQDKLGEELTEIVNQVNKMAEIIDHMRIFTRKSEGMPEEMIDLNTVIEGPFKLLNQQLKSHNIEVVTELAPALPRVTGDPIRLEQVFMNLITNARKAMDGCGKENKRIEIRTYKVDNRKEVAAEVKDNGIGIPEDLRDKIFQPFFTTTDPGKGTGLGLSVSGKIVEEHGGRIELESEEGKGSTFRVILPIAG